ncbi:MAG: crotonase/enoyl-CoA hydratase family protein [Deinococcales bacterium]|nr:crotonase/enoyl-CoA hydratase family protein [Deinococcales bacterium]
MSANSVYYTVKESIAIVSLDDGKANALNHALIEGINSSLDKATDDAKAVVLTGRAGKFSAGVDLSVLRSGPKAALELVTEEAKMLLKLFLHPQPVIAASTGHSMAAGAFMLHASDTRIGSMGDFKIGLNEVSLGLHMSEFGFMLARERLSKRHFTAAIIQGQLYSPEEAIDVGFLDRLSPADAVLNTALEEAQRLLTLDASAYAYNKQVARGALVTRVLDNLESNILELVQGI